MGGVLHRRRPGKAMPEPPRLDRTELLGRGKDFLANREPEQERRRPGSTPITELLPEAKAASVGPRALLDTAQRRSQRRRRRELRRAMTAKAPVHHRMTRGLILMEPRLSSCSTHESLT